MENGSDANKIFKSLGGTLLDAAEARMKANSEVLEDPASAGWERKEAKEGLKKWREAVKLFGEFGAKQQREL